MRTKRVFSLTSLFLAGAAVCGCQSTNPTPPIRQPAPWQQTSTTQPRTLQGQPMYSQGSTGTSGMVPSTGTGGVPQYSSSTQYNTPPSYTTSSTQSVGSMNTTGGTGLYNGTSSGMSSPSSLGGSTGGTSYAPQSSTPPSFGSGLGSQRSSNYGSPSSTDVGGMSVRQTQCPTGACPTDDARIPPPPSPANTLQQQ
jgi:hypothetical protein